MEQCRNVGHDRTETALYYPGLPSLMRVLRLRTCIP